MEKSTFPSNQMSSLNGTPINSPQANSTRTGLMRILTPIQLPSKTSFPLIIRQTQVHTTIFLPTFKQPWLLKYWDEAY
jgi:hypothetical protein